MWIDRVEQKYLPAIYKLANVFWIPTKFEIFGMVLLEAMYYGVPVISTFNGGSSILIKHGVNGFICEDTEDSWVDYTHELVINKEFAESIGDKAHETIELSFTWDTLADKFIEIYRRKCNE